MVVGDVFQALSDPTRRAVLERLGRGEMTVSALHEHFAISQPALSQHLAALRAAGLVRTRREGRHAYYRVDPRGLRPLVDLVDRYRAFWPERLNKLEAVLKGMDDDHD